MTIEIAEEDRQLMVMALAHLAVERPGWDDALGRIAERMDNLVGGRPELYGRFKELHSAALEDERKQAEL